MKKFTTFLFILAIAISTAMAQAPQQFKYQAALRDTDGTVMANEAVTVEIAILQGSTSGSSVFAESHDVTTTAQGIINLNIGSQADLSTVDWSADTYFIQITVDGTVMGASQLLSVPYAQFADEAGNTFSGNYADLTNQPELFSGNYSDLTDKPVFADSVAEYGFSGNYDDLTNTPQGTVEGEMLYWDGSQWVNIAPGGDGEILMFNNGTPEWNNYEPGLATVVFDSVYDITGYNAFCDANVTSEGGNAVTERGILWGVSSGLNINDDNKIVNGSSSGAFTTEISGIEHSTTYYVRAYALNSAGTTYSEEVSFSTNLIGLPVVTTANVTDIDGATASSGGEVTDNGGFSVTARGVCWSTADNPTISDNFTTDGTGLGTYTSGVTGLSPDTDYYLRAYATNAAGTSYGETQSFTTTEGLPVIVSNIVEVGNTTAMVNSEITTDGGYAVNARGVCWSSSPNPTVSSNNTSDGSGTGSFTSSITGLTDGTTYYVRGYASNSIGTVYSEEFSFTAGDLLVLDIDGNTYEAVQIGTQVWMAENLKTTTYNNGTPIELVEDDTDWENNTTGAYCWYDNDETTYADTYGTLYNGYAVETGNLCPDGWHVPTDAEWTALENYIASDGHSGSEGTALKATSGWNYDGNGTDDYGFSALPGGNRSYNGAFGHVGSYGSWWSATEYESNKAWYRELSYLWSNVIRSGTTKDYGFSVRCVRD